MKQFHNYQVQRPAIHRAGVQGVHPALRHEPCADVAILPTIEWEVGTSEYEHQVECIRP